MGNESAATLKYYAAFEGARAVGLDESTARVAATVSEVGVGLLAGGVGAVAARRALLRTAPKIGASCDAGALIRAGQVLDRGGLTRAGRALEKHRSRPGSVFPMATGNVASKNAQGQAALIECSDPLIVEHSAGENVP